MKSDFPIFQNIPDLIYLDSTATTQKPQVVINSITHYYEYENANINRGVHFLGEIATTRYEEARIAIADFIKAKRLEEIIFTRNTTESLNLVAYILSSKLTKNDTVLLSEMEHHSNIVPWQILSKQIGFNIKYIPITEEKTLDLSNLDDLFNNVKILSLTYVSNTLGTINPIKEIIHKAKQKNIITIIDAAQASGHLPIDVVDLDCDFLAFSGHKMYAPMGIGVLYGKYELLNKLPPFLGGGDMIQEVFLDRFTTAELPNKYEAGTPNVEGAIGLKTAIDYIRNIGWDSIHTQEKEIFEYAYNKLSKYDWIDIISPRENNVGIISFNIKGVHPHDVTDILSNYKICLRAGHHCTQPLMHRYKLNATNRLSIGIYNDKNDIDKTIEVLETIYNKYK